MFGLFKKKSEKEKLQKLYTKLLADAHKLSTSNRKLSDEKVYEAEQVMKQIEALEKQS
ncbi:Lacal_2735 family protein [Tenacibaculum sp. SZ-18]|uniref:Lacal_2735 family protein n=1 Tax=Tenacibaculum sp. SZ-18 TaxID=754423 RepID=UPI0012FD34F6|nr:Lacal_2735 family protein [Tenacibaculum sp. SZ-18]